MSGGEAGAPRHRVNVTPSSPTSARYWLALCADCPWQVRGVARERADEFARAHERDPREPVPGLPHVDARA